MMMHRRNVKPARRGVTHAHTTTHCSDVVYVVRREVVACIEVQRHDEQAHEDLVADAGAQERAVLVVARRAVLHGGYRREGGREL